MSKRFALLDTASGYYYGAFNADDAIGACRIFEKQEPHPYPVDFKPAYASELASNDTGWFVYEVPADFDSDGVLDGQSTKTTDLIATFPRVEIVKVVAVDPNADRDRSDWIASCEASNA
jgi:hypothetical protein